MMSFMKYYNIKGLYMVVKISKKNLISMNLFNSNYIIVNFHLNSCRYTIRGRSFN